jgi:N-carbamoyl-L-amino-acid hydrolase
VITAASLAGRLAELDGIGVEAGGAVYRLAWTPEDSACRAWFDRQARAAGLTVECDPAGNLWACPDADPPWYAVGSHLDSVRGGGRFDGPLGVACGFEIAHDIASPVAVISFADEEGARFNTPTFGSKALTGRLDVPRMLERADEHGTTVAEAMQAAGVDPRGIAAAAQGLSRLRGFLEIHIDQSTDVAAAGVPVAIVSSLAARVRLEVDLRGRADHAGTTPPRERRDALAAAARLIVAADELGETAGGPRTTTARIVVQPNAATTIAAHVKLWIDARSPGVEAIEFWREALAGKVVELAERTGVEITADVASRSDGREFSRALRQALVEAAQAQAGRPVPEAVCFAGHDAGVLAERVPAAMVLVRNPTGVSHAPQERIDLDDAVVAARAVRAVLTRSSL